jgi:O-methyltransferase involved in polyketide biosynthesis
MAAAARAAHLLVDDDPKIFEDTVALALLGSDADELVEFHRSSAEAELAASLRVTMTTRSRYVEQRLAKAVRRGVDQYVILGAGLDSFPYRSPLVDEVRERTA